MFYMRCITKLLYSSLEPLQSENDYGMCGVLGRKLPFTTALLSLWESIIHTDWPHTWTHTHTQTHEHTFINTYCSMPCGRLSHTHIHTQSIAWTLVGRCVDHSPHYNLPEYVSEDISCPTHADRHPNSLSPTVPPPTRCGVCVYVCVAPDVSDTEALVLGWQPYKTYGDVKPQGGVTGSHVRGCSTITWTTHICTRTCVRTLIDIMHSLTPNLKGGVSDSGERTVLSWQVVPVVAVVKLMCRDDQTNIFILSNVPIPASR